MRHIGQRQDEDNHESLAVLMIQSSVLTAEPLHHGVDAVQGKRRHQQQVVHHRNTLFEFSKQSEGDRE